MNADAWISITESLPSDSRYVLVYVGLPKAPSGEMHVGAYLGDEGGGEWALPQGLLYRTVTHWQELPADPQEGD